MIGLKQCKLFLDLPERDYQALERIAQTRNYAPGQILFQEGEEGDGLYLILHGQVLIQVKVTPEEQRVLSQLGTGDFFGEMALMDNGPRSATACACSEVTIAFLPRIEVIPIMQTSPNLALSLNRHFSLRLREFNRRYLEEMLQAERLSLIGRFARSIVHDFKNPLAIISLAAELGSTPNATPQMRHVAQSRIQKQVDRLSNMINELLEFSRGAVANNILAPTDYAAFVMPLLDEINAEISSKSVTLSIPALPPAIKLLIDPRRLTHVFYNLVHNAVDAMPQGGQIIIRFRRETKELITEIQDTGPGIDPAIADRLFEPFATHGKAHGTGLGLSICRRIIEDHCGRIRAANAPDHGAIFSVFLPIPP
jgi:signal transduction histidine kinase